MSVRELRELALACACHLAVRLALRMLRFKTFLRLARIELPSARRPLALACVQRLVRRGRRISGGTCLSESVVMGWLAGRHGHRVPRLTIGVAREAGVFRAHAWTEDDATGFAPLWSKPGRGSHTWPV